MKRIKCLNWYQKGVLLFMAAMTLIFTALYPMTMAREGFAYKNAILVPDTNDGNTVYSGKIQGKQAVFTVSADKTVTFRYGDTVYGPYTVKTDPTAIPRDSEMGELMVGVELRRGEKLLFRGGVLEHGELRWLYNEDGSLENLNFSATTEGGIAADTSGDSTGSMEPSIFTIVDLMAGPEITHKGEWMAWFCGVFVCAATAVSILFADELFRWNLSFQIRHADRAEPSEWEMAGRYISWTVLPVVALVLFVMGIR